MKKILMTICAVMISAVSFAQMGSGGFHLGEGSTYYGLRLGFNSSYIGGDVDLDSRPGLNIGAVVGLKCSPSVPLFLESGLYYAPKGGKKGAFKTRLDYLEIPVLMKYGIDVKGVDGLAVLPYIGPTFGFGIGGKVKPGNTDAFDDGAYNRFDVGIKLGCGVEYNMVYWEMGYQWGVVNISDIDEIDAFNRSFFMNIGINF
jgi:hypothetical protein